MIHHNRLKKYFGPLSESNNPDTSIITTQFNNNKREYRKNPKCSRWNKSLITQLPANDSESTSLNSNESNDNFNEIINETIGIISNVRI